MNRLIVYLHGRQAGEFAQAEEMPPVFTYDATYLAEAGAAALSRQLPLRVEPFSGRPVRAFFTGVLPEADARDRIAAVLGISPENDFALMERIGGECAGAVSFLPRGASPAAGPGRLRWLDSEELADVIRELPRRPLMAGTDGVRLSLAGAQIKLPVVLPSAGTKAGGEAALPLDGTASTHIIKPEPERFPGLAANEAYCMALARAAGLNAAETEWRMIGGTPCLVARRYDRIMAANGRVDRLHQEDFCQAMGIPPERKYQQEGGPSLPDCFALLRDWSTVPVLDMRDFLDAVIFQVLIGNADAHGKNFSFLYTGGGRRLAPLYDQVCTLAWAELSKTLSMKVGSAATLAEVSPEHFRQLSSQARLGWPLVRERLAGLCQRVADAIEGKSISPPLEEAAREIKPIIIERTERMLRLLER